MKIWMEVRKEGANMKRRIASLTLATAVLTSIIFGCGGTGSESSSAATSPTVDKSSGTVSKASVTAEGADTDVENRGYKDVNVTI